MPFKDTYIFIRQNEFLNKLCSISKYHSEFSNDNSSNDRNICGKRNKLIHRFLGINLPASDWTDPINSEDHSGLYKLTWCHRRWHVCTCNALCEFKILIAPQVTNEPVTTTICLTLFLGFQKYFLVSYIAVTDVNTLW